MSVHHIQWLFIPIFALLFTGCVSKSTYQQKAYEAELLSDDVALLQLDISELKAVKIDLEEQRSALNQRLITALNDNSALQKTLISTRADQTRQSQSFAFHQDELNEQIQQQQTANEQLIFSIDQLQQEKKALADQLEREKIAREARVAKLKNTYDQLVSALEKEIERGEITITNLEGKLSVNLLSQILFESGKTDIRDEGKKLLHSLGDVINAYPDKALSIEGHTDNLQITSRLKDRFASNWELSTARATSIVHYLQDTVGISGDRLAATGFGEYRPVADNATPQGRAQNRRIQINLIPYEQPPVR
ncbi:MAG: hypothetical protein C0618_06425 [Desulfuromonas sp.]|nr:MAG: hypothetical protein C0618_06425 [Desulfuromonas sp.]